MTPDLSAWGGCAIIRPLAGGHRSEPYLVGLGDQLAVARRTDRNLPDLRWLEKCLAVAARAGLGPPQMIPTLNGQLAYNGWRMEQFIDGTPATKSDLAALATPLRRFHAMGRALPPCRPTLSPLLPPKLHVQLGRLLPTNPVSAIHGDLHPGNLLRDTKGRLRLIDWDEARTGPVAFDAMHLRRKSPQERRQRSAVEALEGWQAEPEYARNLVRRILAQRQKMG